MSELPEFEQTYAAAVPELSREWRAAPVEDPTLLVLDEDVARGLGLDPEWLRSEAGVRMLTGAVPEDVPTYAQAYAGHQFGSYSPVLGDGRALLLGEILDPEGHRHDLHLKGSGRTPFARGGDGLAAVGPMLREYLMGVAMHALGIPTTRALAVVATGTPVRRERPLPGAILARVADSHLRVGTFQYAAALGRYDVLRSLAEYAIDRHHPQARDTDNRYLGLFDAVATAQADLVADWMAVGFVHGVMNTDNMTISGQTIDYGPCAFVDAHDPATVFSSIDHGGRYAYGNQPGIAQWNLARLGEALLPLIADPDAAGTSDGIPAAVDAATEVLGRFAHRYREGFIARTAAKMGLPDDADPQAVEALVTDGLDLLTEQHVDHTRFFRGLVDDTARAEFADPGVFDAWERRRAALVPDSDAARARMAEVNPIYIPRNHVVEQVLTAAVAGDLTPLHRVVDVLRNPFTPHPDGDDLAHPAPAGAAPHVTYCGT